MTIPKVSLAALLLLLPPLPRCPSISSSSSSLSKAIPSDCFFFRAIRNRQINFGTPISIHSIQLQKSAMGSSSSFWNIASREATKSGVFLAKVYCFLHVTTNYLGFATYSFGPSMIPTLHPSGNILLAERISARSQRKLIRGDIVVFQSPENPTKTPTKRVVGIEGDYVSFVVDPRKDDKSKTIVVPKGHVWVQGDYTQDSRDSRNFGPVPYGLIQGRVLWRVWPFQDFGPLGPNPT